MQIRWKLMENDRVNFGSNRPKGRLFGKLCRHVSRRVVICFEWLLQKFEALMQHNTISLCAGCLFQYLQSCHIKITLKHFFEFRRWSDLKSILPIDEPCGTGAPAHLATGSMVLPKKWIILCLVFRSWRTSSARVEDCTHALCIWTRLEGEELKWTL
jgi:hypothetical protein